VFLAVLGVGVRLAFLRAFPTQPFWDFLQLVHFGELLRDHGPFAYGWYWAQFNPGLPLILAGLFRVFPGDDASTARIATAAATGLVPLLPYLIWRPVMTRRIRLLAGVLLAAWPGQVFFSGTVSQDNWVMLPAVALAALAIRRLADPSDAGRPVSSALLYAAALAIRQEMAIVLLPLALSAATPWRSWKRRLPVFAAVTAAGVVLLGAQRNAATKRFSIATEHGALGLFGSFVPGASGPGWIDARAYAEALEPDAPKRLYGDPSTLVRLTVREAKRRPAFHALRIATWLPRLALNTDADNLFWSTSAPRALPESRREAGLRFADAWRPVLRVELAVIQGLFLGAVLLAIARRDAAVLVTASAVALKLLVHAVVSPLGRLIVPAVAFELVAIAAAARLWAGSSQPARRAAGLMTALLPVLLLAGVSRLESWITRRDDPVMPGVHAFPLRAGPLCTARCELESGQLIGLAPAWVRVRAGGDAALRCSLPLLDEGETLLVKATEVTNGGSATVEELRAARPSRAAPVGPSGAVLRGDAPDVRLTVAGSDADATISFETVDP